MGNVNTIAKKPSPTIPNEIVIEVAKEYLSAILPSKGDTRILAIELSVENSAITVKEKANSSLKYEAKNDADKEEATFHKIPTNTTFIKLLFLAIRRITSENGDRAGMYQRHKNEGDSADYVIFLGGQTVGISENVCNSSH